MTTQSDDKPSRRHKRGDVGRRTFLKHSVSAAAIAGLTPAFEVFMPRIARAHPPVPTRIMDAAGRME